MSRILWIHRLGTSVVIERRDEISRVRAYKHAFKSLKNRKTFSSQSFFFQGTLIEEVIYAPFGMRWSPLNQVSCNTTAMTLLAWIISLQNSTFFTASVPMVLTTLLFFHWHQCMLRRCEKASKKWAKSGLFARTAPQSIRHLHMSFWLSNFTPVTGESQIQFLNLWYTLRFHHFISPETQNCSFLINCPLCREFSIKLGVVLHSLLCDTSPQRLIDCS